MTLDEAQAEIARLTKERDEIVRAVCREVRAEIGRDVEIPKPDIGTVRAALGLAWAHHSEHHDREERLTRERDDLENRLVHSGCRSYLADLRRDLATQAAATARLRRVVQELRDGLCCEHGPGLVCEDCQSAHDALSTPPTDTEQAIRALVEASHGIRAWRDPTPTAACVALDEALAHPALAAFRRLP